MGLQTEIWKNELLKKFRAMGGHFAGVPDYSSDVMKGKVIHLADIGADPTVLINNTSYPLASADRTDSDVAITLDLLETTNTTIPYQSLFNLPYDKRQSVIDQHKAALFEKYMDKATHAVAPTAETAHTPMVKTTGSGTIKALTIADVVSMKKKFDDLKIPKEGRRLVLCNEHVQDLLNISESFTKQYNMDNVEGKVGKLFGFDIYEYPTMPIYDWNAGTPQKEAFGTAYVAQSFASVAFYAPRIFRADGELMPFLQEAKDDPANRQTMVGYAMRGIILPKKTTGEGAAIGVIVSGQ